MCDTHANNHKGGKRYEKPLKTSKNDLKHDMSLLIRKYTVFQSNNNKMLSQVRSSKQFKFHRNNINESMNVPSCIKILLPYISISHRFVIYNMTSRMCL